MSPTTSFLSALAPIVLVIILLILRVPALWAALAALATALVGTWLGFPLTAQAVTEVGTTMGPTTLTVVFILLGGVALAEMTSRSGAQEVISRWLRNTEHQGDRLTTLLLIAFGVTPFMESVTGFGLGVVITAPLLVGLGLTPVKAIITGMLGLVLVPWGSLGPGTLVAAELGGVDFVGIGVWSALLSLPVLLINVGLITVLNHPRITVSQGSFMLLLVLGQWITLILANWLLGPPLAGVLASAAVIATILLRMRFNGSLPKPPPGLFGATVPYLILVVGLLGSSALLALPGPTIQFIANPALWLNISVLATLALQRSQAPALRSLGRAVWRRWQGVTLVTLLYMLLGSLMSANGMARQLAETAASLGTPFVFLVPLIGALGGYLTGSNTGAAAMFSTATATAGAQVGANPLIVLAAQNVAGSIAIIASPPRMAFAASVVFAPEEKLPATVPRVLLCAVGTIVLLLALLMPWVSSLDSGF